MSLPEFDSHRSYKMEGENWQVLLKLHKCLMVYMHTYTPTPTNVEKRKKEVCLIIVLTLSGLLMAMLLFTELYNKIGYSQYQMKLTQKFPVS